MSLVKATLLLVALASLQGAYSQSRRLSHSYLDDCLAYNGTRYLSQANATEVYNMIPGALMAAMDAGKMSPECYANATAIVEGPCKIQLSLAGGCCDNACADALMPIINGTCFNDMLSAVCEIGGESYIALDSLKYAIALCVPAMSHQKPACTMPSTWNGTIEYPMVAGAAECKIPSVLYPANETMFWEKSAEYGMKIPEIKQWKCDASGMAAIATAAEVCKEEYMKMDGCCAPACQEAMMAIPDKCTMALKKKACAVTKDTPYFPWMDRASVRCLGMEYFCKPNGIARLVFPGMNARLTHPGMNV